MKKFWLLELIFVAVIFASCFTTTTTGNNVTSTKNTDSVNSRDIILDGKTFTDEQIKYVGGITSWYCTDKYSSSRKILLEVGYFNEYEDIGFILYDGSNEGIRNGVWHHRDGLDHRWDWGDDDNGKYKYSFVIEPDGTAMYYYFRKGESTTKPSSFYKAHRR